jgi:hypothetical protein
MSLLVEVGAKAGLSKNLPPRYSNLVFTLSQFSSQLETMISAIFTEETNAGLFEEEDKAKEFFDKSR